MEQNIEYRTTNVYLPYLIGMLHVIITVLLIFFGYWLAQQTVPQNIHVQTTLDYRTAGTGLDMKAITK